MIKARKFIFMLIITAIIGGIFTPQFASAESGKGGSTTVTFENPYRTNEKGYVECKQGDTLTFNAEIGGGMRGNGASAAGLTADKTNYRDMYTESATVISISVNRILHRGSISYNNPVVTVTLDTTNVPIGDYRLFFVHIWANSAIGGSAYFYVDISILTDTAPSLPNERPPVWAALKVNEAIRDHLVPQSMQSGYSQPTTRAEFCSLAVRLYEIVTGREISERTGFSDTNDIDVEKIAGIGIVNGVGNNMFAPDNDLTREQAATLLSRLMIAIGIPPESATARFSDNGAISAWALEAVGQMQASGIMQGEGDNRFDPKGSYTRAQSIYTIKTIYDIVMDSVVLPQIVMYAEFQTVPDFGAFAGAALSEKTVLDNVTSTTTYYYYDLSSHSASKSGEYIDLLIRIGFNERTPSGGWRFFIKGMAPNIVDVGIGTLYDKRVVMVTVIN